MSINFDSQVYCSLPRYYNLRHTNFQNGANLSGILYHKSYFITLIKRVFVRGNKYTKKKKLSIHKKRILNVSRKIY